MVTVMTARSPAARTAANAALQRVQRRLNADRSTIEEILGAAEHTLSDHAALPSLPS